MNKIIRQIIRIKYIEYIFLTIVILLGFIVRLYKISNPLADWHSWRQADTASVSKTFFEQGINLLYPRYQDVSSIQTGYLNPRGYRFVEFPIFNLLHVTFHKLAGKFAFDLSGRLISVFSAMVSSFFLFLIGRRFLGKWGGLMAAFFFLFIPYNIYFSRVVLPEPLGTTFAIIGVWGFIRFIDYEKKLGLYLSAVFFALAALIKPFTLFYCVPLIYLLFQKYKFKQVFKNPKILIPLLIFADIVLIPLFAWRTWMNQHLEGIPFFAWAFNGDKIRFRPAYWYWIYGERLGKMILGVWGMVPFAFGILSTKKKKAFNLFFLLKLNF